MSLPEKSQQIVQVHAGLIYRVVKACQNRAAVPELDGILRESEANGWTQLVAAIRQILNGRRDTAVLAGLDEEDHVIAEAILRGLQDPSTLPDPERGPDAMQAAPGLAHMIHAAHSNVPMLHQLAGMTTQMTQMGGDMARLGGIMKRLVDGERNADILCRGMGPQGEQLVLKILEELGKLESQ